MTTYVEISDEGAARRAAARLISVGQRFGAPTAPPDPETVEWGDDEFGEHMRNEYLKLAEDTPALPLPERCGYDQQELGAQYCELGEAVHNAIETLTLQDLMNSVDMDRVQAPEADAPAPADPDASPEPTDEDASSEPPGSEPAGADPTGEDAEQERSSASAEQPPGVLSRSARWAVDHDSH